MPKFAPSHRAANATPAGVAPGTGAIVGRAARETLERLGNPTPVAAMGLIALQLRVLRLYREHFSLGGDSRIEDVSRLGRRSLRELIGELQAANASLRRGTR